jgi:hypothetical protein
MKNKILNKLIKFFIKNKNEKIKSQLPFDVYKRNTDGVYIIDCSRMTEINIKIPIIIYDEDCKI